MRMGVPGMRKMSSSRWAKKSRFWVGEEALGAGAEAGAEGREDLGLGAVGHGQGAADGACYWDACGARRNAGGTRERLWRQCYNQDCCGGYSSAAERLTVAQDVVGSIPTIRPKIDAPAAGSRCPSRDDC